MLSRKKRKLLCYQLGYDLITDPKVTLSVCSTLDKRHKRYAAEWNRGIDAVPLVRLARKSKEHVNAITD